MKNIEKWESTNQKNEEEAIAFLERVTAIIHKNINDSNFATQHLVRELGMSKSQLYRNLKAISGKSTAIFIRSIRLQASKEMLQTTEKSVTEVAYDVGFKDPSWFSRAFKEEFGCSPSEIK